MKEQQEEGRLLQECQAEAASNQQVNMAEREVTFGNEKAGSNSERVIHSRILPDLNANKFRGHDYSMR